MGSNELRCQRPRGVGHPLQEPTLPAHRLPQEPSSNAQAKIDHNSEQENGKMENFEYLHFKAASTTPGQPSTFESIHIYLVDYDR